MNSPTQPRGRVNGQVPLSELAPGARAVVVEVDPSSPIGRRLQDRGFVPDTPVRVLRRAPLGDPVVYELRGVRLALRRSEAARIGVRPDADPAPPRPLP